jgi:hypothetical protein
MGLEAGQDSTRHSLWSIIIYILSIIMKQWSNRGKVVARAWVSYCVCEPVARHCAIEIPHHSQYGKRESFCAGTVLAQKFIITTQIRRLVTPCESQKVTFWGALTYFRDLLSPQRWLTTAKYLLQTTVNFSKKEISKRSRDITTTSGPVRRRRWRRRSRRRRKIQLRW